MDFIFGSISTHLISSAGLTLIHFVWQAAAVALVLKLSLAIIPQKYLLTRYRVAVLALVVTVGLPCFTLYSLLQSPDFVQSTIDYSTKAISLIEQLPEAQSSTHQSGVAETSEQITGITEISSYIGSGSKLLFNLLIIWVIGCLFMLGKFVFNLNTTYKLAKEGVLPVNQQINEIVSRLGRRYNLSRPIKILKSSVVNVPVVVGWLRPVILLPIAISVGLDKAQLELIIAHELAHIKRMDFAVNILQNLVQIVFFYHPAVHWINQVIREEREYICDAMALDIIGNNTNAKLNLAKALLNTEELREGNFSLIAVAASGGKLKNRISHILEGEYRPATSIKALLLSVFAFIFSLAAMASAISFEDSSNNFQEESNLLEQIEMDRPKEMELDEKRIAEEDFIGDTNITVRNHYSKKPELVSKPESRKIENDTSNLVSQTGNNKTQLGQVSKSVRKALLLASADTSQTAKTKLVVSSEKNSLQSAKLNKQIKESSQNLNLKSDKQIKRFSAYQLANEVMVENEAENLTHINSDDTATNNESYQVASLDLNSVKDYVEPKAIYTPYPRYPKQSWRKMNDQVVSVNFVINSDGYVEDIDIQGRVGRPFSREVKHKLRRWRYEPAMESGKNVEHIASLEFVFKAPQEDKIILITTGTRIRQ